MRPNVSLQLTGEWEHRIVPCSASPYPRPRRARSAPAAELWRYRYELPDGTDRMLSSIATLSCTDLDSRGEAVVILRAGPQAVGLCISLRESGDAEVVLSIEDAVRARAALDAAIAHANAASA